MRFLKNNAPMRRHFTHITAMQINAGNPIEILQAGRIPISVMVSGQCGSVPWDSMQTITLARNDIEAPIVNWLSGDPGGHLLSESSFKFTSSLPDGEDGFFDKPLNLYFDGIQTPLNKVASLGIAVAGVDYAVGDVGYFGDDPGFTYRIDAVNEGGIPTVVSVTSDVYGYTLNSTATTVATSGNGVGLEVEVLSLGADEYPNGTLSVQIVSVLAI